MPNDLEIDALLIEPVSQISPTNELDVSAPLNTDKKLQGQKAEGLLDHLLDMLDECGLGQPRLRKRQGSVVESRRYTPPCFLVMLGYS